MNIKFFILFFSFISSVAIASFEDHLKKVENKSDVHQIKNVDFIYLINLDQRPEKLAKSLQQLELYDIHPYRFSAVNGWELTLDTINDIGVKFEPWMQEFITKMGLSDGMWGTSYIIKDGALKPEHEIMHVPGKTYFVHCMGRGTMGIALSHLSILKDAYDSGYETIWVMEDDIDILQDPNAISSLISQLDTLVGKNGWDILFTDSDFRNREGLYVPCTSYAPRPNYAPKDPDKFARRNKISSDFSQIGARYGAHSMIVRRSGMKKILDFTRKYSIFLPFDLDFIFPTNMRLYCTNYDVVSQLPYAISDNGTPPPKKTD